MKTNMFRASAVVALLVIAGCRSSADGPKMYRAYCNTESRHLGPWHEDRDDAEDDRADHRKMYGWHAVRIDTVDGTPPGR